MYAIRSYYGSRSEGVKDQKSEIKNQGSRDERFRDQSWITIVKWKSIQPEVKWTSSQVKSSQAEVKSTWSEVKWSEVNLKWSEPQVKWSEIKVKGLNMKVIILNYPIQSLLLVDICVITSYSIHYTKLYDSELIRVVPRREMRFFVIEGKTEKVKVQFVLLP